jgi:hypothetical protein
MSHQGARKIVFKIDIPPLSQFAGFRGGRCMMMMILFIALSENVSFPPPPKDRPSGPSTNWPAHLPIR